MKAPRKPVTKKAETPPQKKPEPPKIQGDPKIKTLPKEVAKKKPAAQKQKPVSESTHGNCKFDQNMFDEICEKIATTSNSVRCVLEGSGIDRVTWYRWCESDEKLRNQYARAINDQTEVFVDEISEIADNTELGVVTTVKEWGTETKMSDMTEHRRMKIDARKWIAGKRKPKKYGDKLDVTTDGKAIEQVTVFQLPDNNRDKTP